MKKRFILAAVKLALLAVFLLLGPSGFFFLASDYYVSPTGSGTACTQAAPCSLATVDSVITVGPATTCSATSGWISQGGTGACVHIASGNYNVLVIPLKAGSSGARIRYVADTQYGPHMGGTNSSSLIWTQKGPWTDIVGFDFDGLVNSTRTGVIMYAVGSNSQAVSTHAWVLRNKFHDFCPGGGCRGQSALISGGSTTGTFPTQPSADILEANLIYHNDGGAGATMFNDSDGGIDLGWQDIARDNIVIDQGGGTCIQAGHSSTNVIVTNNLMANCTRNGFVLGCEFGCSNVNSTITNNIIVNSGNSGPVGGFGIVNITGGCQATNLWSNNLTYGNIPGDWSTSRCASQLVNTVTGSNSTTFVNYTGTVSGDYHLKAGSTGIASGTTNCASGTPTCAPTIDFSGIPMSSPPPRGPYTFLTAGSPLTPASLPFGNQVVPLQSNPQNLTFTNLTGSPLAITGITVGDPTNYVLGADNCGRSPATIPIGGNCTIPISFFPKSTGLKNSSVTVSFAGGPASSTLSGTGVNAPPPTLTPPSLPFGNVIIQTQGNSQQFTFNNNSGIPLTITGISISDTTNFALVNLTCQIGVPIPTGNTCFIPVAPKPQTLGLKNATVSVSFSGTTGSPLTAGVSVTGVSAPPPPPPTLTPASTTFADRVIFTTSDPQAFTFTNQTGSPIAISDIQLSGTNPTEFFLGTGTCTPGGFSDIFNSGTLDTTKWFIDTGNSPASPNNTGTFSSSNVSLASGMLRLQLDQSIVGGQSTSVGAEIRSKILLGFGNYTWVARAGSQSSTPGGVGSAVSGQVTGLFNFINNSQTEIDFEYEGRLPTQLEMTNFNGIGNSQETNFTQAGADQNFHVYRFNWQPTQITYFVDGVLVSTHTQNIPSAVAAGMINFWGTNSNTFGGTATAGTRYLFVSGFGFAPTTLATVPNNSTCSVPVSFAPKTAGAKSAVVTVTHNGTGGSLSSTVSGTALASPPPPNPTLTPTSTNYGSVVTGTTTNPPQQFVFTNLTGSALPITNIAVGDTTNYLLGTDNCPRSPTTLPDTQSCTIPVSARPQTIGTKLSTLTVSYTGGLGSLSSNLSVSGVAPPPPTVTINPTSKSFGSVTAGQQSAEQTFTVSNGIGSTLNIGQLTVTGPNVNSFTLLHDNCSNTAVGSSGNCTYGAKCAPPTLQPAGPISGAITFPDNAAGSPHSSPLTCTVLAPALVITPASPFSFGQVFVGSQSDQVFTATNNGTANAVISNIAAVTGTNFLLVANGCGTVAPAAHCNFTVRFKPLVVGPLSDLIRITSNVSNSPQLVTVSGTGGAVAPSFNPASINFGQVVTGSIISVPVTFTAGSSDVTISSVATSPNFGQNNTCGLLVPAFQQCFFNTTFSPAAVTSYTGTLTVTSTPVSPVVNLSGQGVAAPPPASSPSGMSGTSGVTGTAGVQ